MDRATLPPFNAVAAMRISRRRWALRAVAGLLVGVSLAYATLPLWLPTERVRLQLESDLTGDLGTPVRIGRVRVGWLTGVVIEDLAIAAAPRPAPQDPPAGRPFRDENSPSGGASGGTGSDSRGRLEPGGGGSGEADADREDAATGAPGGAGRRSESGYLARVGRIRCDLAPFSLALGKKIRVLEIADPQIWLEIDERGELRLPAFGEGKSARLPSFNYSVRNLVCHVIAPKVSQSFRIDKVDLQLDPPSGLLHLTSATRVSRPDPDADEPKVGRLDFDANMRIPRLKRSETLNGSIEVEWSDLALHDLPVPLISRVPVEQVDGTTSGRLTIRTHPDLGIDYTVAIAFDGVQIMRPDLNRPAQVPDAELACGGHWDPTEGVVTVGDVLYETPALRLESVGAGEPLLRLDENGEQPVAVRLRGRVKDWRRLRQELPELDHAARQAGVQLDGEASFTAEWVRTPHEDRAKLTLDAGPSECRVRCADREVLTCTTGVAKSVALEAAYERAVRRFRQQLLSIQIGDVRLDASGEAVLPDLDGRSSDDLLDRTGRLAAAFRTVRGELRVRCDDAATLRRVVPCLARVREIDELSGPLDVHAQIAPQSSWTRCVLSLSMPSESQFRSADWVRKDRGRPLAVRVETIVPYAASGAVDLVNLELRYGPGRLTVASSNGSLRYDLNLRETPDGAHLDGAEATWRSRIQLGSVENLIALSPRLSAAASQAGVTFLAGDLEIDAEGQVSYRPGDSILHSRARVIADNIAVRLRDAATKRAGTAMAFDLMHDWRVGREADEQGLTAACVLPAGRVSASYARSGGGAENDEPFELFGLEADIDELGELVSFAPQLAEHAGVIAAGRMTGRLQHMRVGDVRTGTAEFDCTRASIEERRFGLRKAAGIPLSMRIGWREAASDDDGGGRVLSLTDGRAELADARIERIDARFVLGQAGSEPGRPLLETIESGWLEVDGRVRLDEGLLSLSPRLRRRLEQAGVEGAAGWRVALSATSDGFEAQGRIDADGLAFAARASGEGNLCVRQPAGEPLELTFDLSGPWDASELAVHEAEVVAAGNRVTASGSVRRRVDEAGAVADTFSLDVRADMPQLERLHGWYQDNPLETLRGGLVADVAMNGEKGSLALQSGRVQLDDLAFGTADRPLWLNGSLTVAPERVNVQGLDFEWGASGGTLSGIVDAADGRHEARIGFGGRELQIEDLLDCITQLQMSLAGEEPSASTAPAADEQTPVRQVIDLLRRTHLDLDAHADTVRTPLPLGIKAVLDAGWQQVTVQNSIVEMNFGCLVDGGRVAGEVTADLAAADPTYRLTYTADRIEPGTLVDAYLRRTFPGMVATGPLTLIDETIQKLLPAPGEPNPEIGKGQLIIDGGTVSGRAAPMWMARIFPGLNLASYEFSRMHSWFDKTADARVHHQMIYLGDYYNVYMIGWSNPEGFFEYEVGIDFLAGLESEYWANSGQGRVPLFTKTGQVRPDGSLADETVRFVSLRRVLETLFVQNNPLVTGYHAVRKRVLGKN